MNNSSEMYSFFNIRLTLNSLDNNWPFLEGVLFG